MSSNGHAPSTPKVPPHFFRDINMSLTDRENAIRSILVQFYTEPESPLETGDEEFCLPGDEIVETWKAYLRRNVPDSQWIAAWEAKVKLLIMIKDNEVRNFN